MDPYNVLYGTKPCPYCCDEDRCLQHRYRLHNCPDCKSTGRVRDYRRPTYLNREKDIKARSLGILLDAYEFAMPGPPGYKALLRRVMRRISNDGGYFPSICFGCGTGHTHPAIHV
jgi:hypothetical protein